jgi:hypothetical protein
LDYAKGVKIIQPGVAKLPQVDGQTRFNNPARVVSSAQPGDATRIPKSVLAKLPQDNVAQAFQPAGSGDFPVASFGTRDWKIP